MTKIVVEDTKVVITLMTTEGWEFNFSHETGHKAWAALLAASLRRRRNSDDENTWRDSYNRGWADAKSKRPKVTV